MVNWRVQGNAVVRLSYANGIVPLWRSPVMLLAGFLTPLTLVFFLVVIAPSAILPYGIVGAILFTALFTGNGIMNDCAYLRLERQLQQVFVASPVRPTAYALGMALSELAFTLPALVMFLVILWIVTGIGALPVLALLGVVLLTWLMASSFGFLLSTFFRRLREIWPIGAVVFTALSVLPPVFYPMSVIPPGYRWLAFLVPSTYAGQLADRAAGLSVASINGNPILSSASFDLVGLVGFTLLFVLASMQLARWREP
ncbi:MAG: ABC transporter permease [Thermoplasmata archaeon]|nr:ABC transporter permease [Thermoplasmata archaeon]